MAGLWHAGGRKPPISEQQPTSNWKWLSDDVVDVGDTIFWRFWAAQGQRAQIRCHIATVNRKWFYGGVISIADWIFRTIPILEGLVQFKSIAFTICHDGNSESNTISWIVLSQGSVFPQTSLRLFSAKRRKCPNRRISQQSERLNYRPMSSARQYNCRIRI